MRLLLITWAFRQNVLLITDNNLQQTNICVDTAVCIAFLHAPNSTKTAAVIAGRSDHLENFWRPLSFPRTSWKPCIWWQIWNPAENKTLTVSGVTLWKLLKLPTEDAHSSFPRKSDAYVNFSIQNIHAAPSSEKLAPAWEMEAVRYPRDAGALSSTFLVCSWNSMLHWNVAMYLPNWKSNIYK